MRFKIFWKNLTPSTFESTFFLSMNSAFGTKRAQPKAKSRKLSAQREEGKRSFRKTQESFQGFAHVVQCIVKLGMIWRILKSFKVSKNFRHHTWCLASKTEDSQCSLRRIDVMRAGRNPFF